MLRRALANGDREWDGQEAGEAGASVGAIVGDAHAAGAAAKLGNCGASILRAGGMSGAGADSNAVAGAVVATAQVS